MADTYDLAMQLFRVASEKQKIEKSQGKLKPEDEIQFTEASFNDFSQSLSREFSNLSPEEQKEAKRMLELKINDNISEVISGNVNQGFSLNVQSVRNVISSAIEIVEQQKIAQSPQGNVSSIRQDQATNSYQSLIDNYNKTHNINALYNNYYKLSAEEKLNFMENINPDIIIDLIKERDSKYERKSNTIYVLPTEPSISYDGDTEFNEIVSKQEAARRLMKEFKSGSRKFLNILDTVVDGIQNAIGSEFIEPKQDKRFGLVSSLLMESGLPPEMKQAILSNINYFNDFYKNFEDFARESIFSNEPPDKVNFDYLKANIPAVLNLYSDQKETIESKFMSGYKKYERSEKYMSYSDKLIEEFGLSEDQLNVLNSNLELKTTYSDIVTCIFQNYTDTMLASSISEENLRKYYSFFLQKLGNKQKDLFNFDNFSQLIYQNIDNNNIDTLFNKADIPVRDKQNILNSYNDSSTIEYANKSANRRRNISQLLKSTPELSSLSKEEIDTITDLMVKSYNSKTFLNENRDQAKFFNNIMFESYVKENLPGITNDKTVIDAIMKIVHESNKTQMALKYEHQPLMGINYYLDDIQKMLGFKKENSAAISRAIRLSVTSSFPEELNFSATRMAMILDNYKVDFNPKILEDPKSFSKVVSLIRTSHDRFMEEAIYAGSGLSRETIDLFNFEKNNESQKGVISSENIERDKKLKDYKFIKEQYGVDLNSPGSNLPSVNYAKFMDFDDYKEINKFREILDNNKLFSMEFTNMIRKMQAFSSLKGQTSFTPELLDLYKSTYFSDNNQELAKAITFENMQGIFKLINNKDAHLVDDLSAQGIEETKNLIQFYQDMPNGTQVYSDYLKKADILREKYGLMNASQLKASVENDPEPRETNTNEQAKSDSVIDSQSFETEQDIENAQPPAVQQGGLIGFINRFRNNFSNRNKNEGLIVGIKKAFLDAKDNISEEVMDNDANDSHGLKEDQSNTDISQSPNTLDEMSKKLREGINVDNLGVQGVNNNKNRDSEQREAESEEEQL